MLCTNFKRYLLIEINFHNKYVSQSYHVRNDSKIMKMFFAADIFLKKIKISFPYLLLQFIENVEDFKISNFLCLVRLLKLRSSPYEWHVQKKYYLFPLSKKKKKVFNICVFSPFRSIQPHIFDMWDIKFYTNRPNEAKQRECILWYY